MADSTHASATDAEDAARAGLYGLIGRLFYGAPDSNLIAQICQDTPDSAEGGQTDSDLTRAWAELQRACKASFPPVVRQEFDTLFVGVGKAPVTPYLSSYSRDTPPDRYLVQLRERLADWGLVRRSGAGEVEDHVSGICDVMRWLIENGQPIEVQAHFYRTFIAPCSIAFFAAVQDAPNASFYKHVAGLATAFMDIERLAFEVAESE